MPIPESRASLSEKLTLTCAQSNLVISYPFDQRETSLFAEWCSSDSQECPCGYYGDPFHQCNCPPGLVARYQKSISGPFMDRVDIFIEVPHIEYEKLSDDRLGEPSEKVQARVTAARCRQTERFRGSKLN
jgi:hypothetical protein